MSESSSTPRVHIRYAVSLCMLKRSVLVVPTTLPSLSQDPNYWEHRYETQSCSFDWFYGFTACRLLLRTLINRKKVVLQIGCGNSTLQEGMANDGYTIVNVSYTVGEWSAKLGVALESPLCFMHVDGHIFHRDPADGGEAQTHPQPDLYGL